MTKETPQIVSYQSPASDTNDIPPRKLNRQINTKPSSPSSSMAKVIAANTSSPIAVPVPDVIVAEPTVDFGNGDDFGDGWGDGDGGGMGGGFQSIPTAMKKRCSPQDRMQRLKSNGGNEACETAVVKGLDWLQSTQNSDGSWGDSNKQAMTGFAILAFLGHCETPLSPKYGQTVTDAITYLIDFSTKHNGKFSTNLNGIPWCYEQAVCTYAIAESYTFCSSLNLDFPNLKEVTRSAGDWIMEHQHNSGGWDYRYDTSGKRGGDNSINYWHIQALKACKHTGLWKDNDFKRVIPKALEYIESSQGSDGAVGYQKKPEKSPGLTGGAVLAFQMWGKGSSSVARSGAKWIRTNTKFDYNTSSANLYDHYYNAQAMINRGGADWAFYNDLFRDQVLSGQNPDGSWKIPGGGESISHGSQFTGGSSSSQVYRTCLNIFMLEVYYRFLPGTGGK
ncbi:prenyltransferase/squalene oxidase repeat-containing protein [Persicirhabdus sediminis]|uniref:Terpene cyclase/mutase family protein n=1 Tax=Persicirhabdus sediminis TaxID=454144 RepID=A0A8J7MDJ2_9BACT|nr:prenyltransferase/squalene oxidase repeat-containing protein [Persicirhabdus sediminis]MBK1791256.1 terpene cyclase/mutase family protein [Persicirhabdus sediminis]